VALVSVGGPADATGGTGAGTRERITSCLEVGAFVASTLVGRVTSWVVVPLLGGGATVVVRVTGVIAVPAESGMTSGGSLGCAGCCVCCSCCVGWGCCCCDSGGGLTDGDKRPVEPDSAPWAGPAGLSAKIIATERAMIGRRDREAARRWERVSDDTRPSPIVDDNEARDRPRRLLIPSNR
jgi:hypothetical protein